MTTFQYPDLPRSAHHPASRCARFAGFAWLLIAMQDALRSLKGEGELPACAMFICFRFKANRAAITPPFMR
jgi:hypothetical protein